MINNEQTIVYLLEYRSRKYQDPYDKRPNNKQIFSQSHLSNNPSSRLNKHAKCVLNSLLKYDLTYQLIIILC